MKIIKNKKPQNNYKPTEVYIKYLDATVILEEPNDINELINHLSEGDKDFIDKVNAILYAQRMFWSNQKDSTL